MTPVMFTNRFKVVGWWGGEVNREGCVIIMNADGRSVLKPNEPLFLTHQISMLEVSEAQVELVFAVGRLFDGAVAQGGLALVVC